MWSNVVQNLPNSKTVIWFQLLPAHQRDSHYRRALKTAQELLTEEKDRFNRMMGQINKREYGTEERRPICLLWVLGCQEYEKICVRMQVGVAQLMLKTMITLKQTQMKQGLNEMWLPDRANLWIRVNKTFLASIDEM